jgi:hypothetical protein
VCGGWVPGFLGSGGVQEKQEPHLGRGEKNKITKKLIIKSILLNIQIKT